MVTEAHDGLFGRLQEQPADPLLALIGLFRDDPRTDKIDLGVGVYRDAQGRTPVPRAVKAAERRLLETQGSKSYLGPAGDTGFVARIGAVALGESLARDPRLVGLQSPGGTGALRLAAELVAAAKPGATVWLGTPTWPNHPPLMAAAGLQVETYRHYDPATGGVRFDELMSALGKAQASDVAVLHGCCHNPSGADLDEGQWREVAALLSTRGVLPIVDLAYQGLGDGLEPDARGARIVAEACPEMLLAYSCDKNFGVYRDRVGALFLLARDADTARRANSVLHALARANWSMPPDHGAAAVRLVLEDEALTADWKAELDEMCARIGAVRASLAAQSPKLAAVARQRGLFSLLPVSPEGVARLRAEHGIYMAPSGRANLAGLALGDVPRVAAAIAELG